MPGKRVQFDDGTFEAITAVAPDTDKSFEEIADEAVADVLKKSPAGRAKGSAQGERRCRPQDNDLATTTSPSAPMIDALASAGALCYDVPMSTRVEYLFAFSLTVADKAARKQGWRPYGRTQWAKPDGTAVQFICFEEQLAIVPAGTTVHVIGKVTAELRRFKRITLTTIVRCIGGRGARRIDICQARESSCRNLGMRLKRTRPGDIVFGGSEGVGPLREAQSLLVA